MRLTFWGIFFWASLRRFFLNCLGRQSAFAELLIKPTGETQRLQIFGLRSSENLGCGTSGVMSFLRAVLFQRCKENVLENSKFSKSGLQSSRSVAVPRH